MARESSRRTHTILPSAHGWHAGDCVVPPCQALHSTCGLHSGWQQVVHARQQLLPGKTIAGAPTPAIPKPGPQGPGFLCGKILSPLRPPFLGVSPLARYENQLRRSTQQAGRRAVRKKTIVVKDKMQRGYRYTLTAPTGRNFDPEFRPRIDAGANASSWRVRRQIHDGLYQGVSAQLVFARQAREAWPRSQPQLFWRRCEPAALGVAQEGLDLSRTILAAGSSGIAATISAGGFPTRTPARSGAGRPSAGMCGKFSATASRATLLAGQGSARLCCTGRTIAARFERARPMARRSPAR